MQHYFTLLTSAVSSLQNNIELLKGRVDRLKNLRDDIDNDDDDVCIAAEVDLVCTSCHLWRPNEQLPRGASLLLYSMLSTLCYALFSCPILYSMLPRRLFLRSFPLLIQFPPCDAQLSSSSSAAGVYQASHQRHHKQNDRTTLAEETACHSISGGSRGFFSMMIKWW